MPSCEPVLRTLPGGHQPLVSCQRWQDSASLLLCLQSTRSSRAQRLQESVWISDPIWGVRRLEFWLQGNTEVRKAAAYTEAAE